MKINIRTLLLSLLGGIVFNTTMATESADQSAIEPTSVPIEVMANARIFAQFDDQLPAVINYYTESEETAVIDFYQSKYGTPTASERKRGRLTLSFSNALHNTRVVISEQNNSRQVDILVTKK